MSHRGANPERKKSGAPFRVPPVRRRKAALTIEEASAGMLVVRLSVRAPDVVFVKGIIEASEGIALIFAERGGELTIAAPQGRGAELKELVEDIALEVGGQLSFSDASEGPAAALGAL
jgi:hypothetical protein